MKQRMIDFMVLSPLWYVLPRRVKLWCFMNDGECYEQPIQTNGEP